MSITLTNPTGYVSAQDALWSIGNSTNSSNTDFKYVFDIFNGNEQLVRVKLFPEANGYGYFDASKIIKNEFSYDYFIPENNSIYLDDRSNSITYQVRLGEEYSGITYLNLASGNVTAYNFTPALYQRRALLNMTNKWLTTRPLKAKIGLTEKLMIGYLGQGTDYEVNWKTYNSANQLIDQDNVVLGTFTEKFLQFDIGPNALNATMDYTVIDNNVSYYKIQIYDATEDVLSDWFYVYLDCNPIYTSRNLHFINRYGMFETARFSKASKLNMNIERKAYAKREYKFDGEEVIYETSGIYNESKINYGSKSNWTYKLTMDFPNDQEYEWLSELMQSPQIYFEIDGEYYPVTLTATNYEYSTFTNNQLRVFELEIELNQLRYGFRR